MSLSNLSEMKAESMQMLCSLSNSEANHCAIIEAGGIDALIRCMQYEDDNTCRLAVSALANLISAKQGPIVVGVFKKYEGVDLLCKLVTSRRVQIQREVTRIMKNITADPCQFQFNSQQKDCFSSFLASNEDYYIQQQRMQISSAFNSM